MKLRLIGAARADCCRVMLSERERELIVICARQALPEALQELATGKQSSTAIVAGADHLYTGVYRELLERIESWLRKNNLEVAQ